MESLLNYEVIRGRRNSVDNPCYMVLHKLFGPVVATWYRVEAKFADSKNETDLLFKAYKANPKNTQLGILVGQAFFHDEERGDDLRTLGELILEQNPNQAAAHNFLGKSEGEKNKEKALEHFFSAVQCCPKEYAFTFNVGLMLYHLGDNETAKEMFEQAIRLDPSMTSPYSCLGDLHKEQEKFTDAVGYYKVAAILDPENAKAYHSLSICYEALKNIQAASQHSQIAASKEPRNFSYQLRAGKIFYHEEKYAQALSYLKRAVALNPEHDEAERLRHSSALQVSINMGKN